MIAQGNKVLVIKEADYKTMQKAAASVEAEWIKQATAKGLTAPSWPPRHAIGNRYLNK